MLTSAVDLSSLVQLTDGRIVEVSAVVQVVAIQVIDSLHRERDRTTLHELAHRQPFIIASIQLESNIVQLIPGKILRSIIEALEA